jgi:hypothetical protein
VTDRDALKQDLVAAYAAHVEAVMAASEDPAQAAPAVLAQCEQAGREATAALYATASALAAGREAPPACPDGCGPMHRHVRFARPVISLAGAWRGTFQRWRCPVCGQGACPSYDAWLRFACTPETQAAALGQCARVPYETAEAQLAQHRVHLSDNTLQRLVGAVGGERLAARQAEAAAVMDLSVRVRPVNRPRRLYIQADARSARVDGQWVWVLVAVFFETAATGLDEEGRKPEPERVSVVAHHGRVAEFEPLVVAEAQRRGILGAGEVVLVGDGGNWVWPLLEGLVPLGTRVTKVLDWYHLTGHLAEAVRARWGEPLNELAYQRLKRSAWAGDSNELLRGLRGWRDEVLAAAEPGAASEAAAVLTRAINYVREHRGRMDYQRLDLDGYHCGSGQVESRCKQLGLRIKGPGMDWSAAGLNALLTILADELTDPEVRRAA